MAYTAVASAATSGRLALVLEWPLLEGVTDRDKAFMVDGLDSPQARSLTDECQGQREEEAFTYHTTRKKQIWDIIYRVIFWEGFYNVQGICKVRLTRHNKQSQGRTKASAGPGAVITYSAMSAGPNYN